MPRALLLCLTIVAAFAHRPAMAAAFVDAPITPEVIVLGARNGLDPVAEPSRFLADLVRAIYPSSDTLPVVFDMRTAAAVPANAPTVPVPLSAELWGRVVFRRLIPPTLLLPYLLQDSRAALLARGLAGLDEPTLAYLEQHPDVIRALYDHGAFAFGAFGHIVRVHDGRMVLPGGEAAVALWEAAVHAPVTAPELFVPALFTTSGGRLAYVVDTIAAAEPAAAQFSLGLWITDPTVRIARFRALVAACVNGFGEWRITERPFLRPLGDLAMVLLRVQLDSSSTLAQPNDVAFWSALFGGPARAVADTGQTTEPASARSDAPTAAAGSPAAVTALADGRIDAAWILQMLSGLDMYARAERLDQFAFGQRVAPMTRAASADLAHLISAFPTRRMLLLTLERMGVQSARTYRAALGRADDLEHTAGPRRFWTLAQYQGVLAILMRMRRVGLLEAADAEALVVSVSAVTLDNGEYRGGIAEWVRTRGSQMLPEGPTWEARFIAALAGREHEAAAPHLEWEGQSYRVDIAQADRQRIEIVRTKQGGQTVDLAIDLHAISRELRATSLTAADAGALRDRLRDLFAGAQRALRRPAVNLLPAAVEAPRDGAQWVSDELQALERAVRGNDMSRAARAGSSLQTLADIVLAHALVSLVYAVDIGDPQGAALLAGNVAVRHDFGFGRTPDWVRVRQAWALPRQNFQPGQPWHVTGSLLGLDIALAQLSLRRLTEDRVATAPKLPSTEREALAVGVALLDPRRLTDRDLGEIAAAIARGRARIEALRPDDPSLARLVADLRMDGWREREVRWAIAHGQPLVGVRFSLADLLVLGGTDRIADLDAWGTPGLNTISCLCLRFGGSRPWRVVEGRFQLPMLAATMGDLTLAVAVRLAELRLPAALMRPVLTIAMQDFIDELSARYDADWWGLSQQAQRVSLRRVEDYVAAAAAVDGPLIPDSGVPASRD